MFILENSNNETDNTLSAAHFELGIGQPCYGALIAAIGIEGDKTLTLPAPSPTGSMVEVSVKGLRINRLDAIEYMGHRYTRTLGEPDAGEFYWDTESAILAIKVLNDN